MMLTTGLHANVPHDVYHARHVGVVSKSVLDLVGRSPAHYRAWLDGADEEETPALAFGSAFHCAILEPERFAREYATEPDFGDCRRKANREDRDAWRERHAAAKPLSSGDAEKITAMIASVRAHPLAGRMLREGEPELTVVWTDEATRLRCKSRADYYVRRRAMIVDVKTTLDARPDAFRRDVTKYRYHVQDALYRDGFAAVGERVQHFVFVAVEKEPPHVVAIYALDAEAIARGQSAARRNIETLAECVQRNEWPGYSASIQTLTLPPWAA